jgi:type IV pilus assembly protein PilY1
LFAYVPSFLYQGPNNTPSVDGLAALANTSFIHHYYVNTTPKVFDVDFKNTYNSTKTSNDWHSILIGGLGKGGKGYYAIDVTDPSSITTETILAGKVLWEFTDSTMGYSYGDPIVVKTKKYGWVVIFTSGYNNSDGIGRIYIVNPATGALLETLSTGVGSSTSPSGLTYASAFVSDYTDYTADAIYAGDLLGNLWRFDLTPTSGSYSAPTKLATLAYNGTAQPVTTHPLIEIDPTTKARYVLVGTGQTLAASDMTSSGVQSFYAIKDGTRSAFDTTTTHPITTSSLTNNTDLLSGVTSSAGWYYNMPTGTNSAGLTVAERVDIDPVANSGIVAWAGNEPDGGVCSTTGNGTSHTYAVNFATGKTVLVADDTASPQTSVASQSNNGLVTDLAFVNVDGTTVRLLQATDQSSLTKVPGDFSSSLSFKVLNWREVPSPD